MKIFLVVLALFLFVGQIATAVAHGDHGVISENSAIYIANNTVKKMTFKDMGFQVGLLEESWKSIASENIRMVEVGEGFYLINVKNTRIKREIFLKINAEGQVLDVFGNTPF